MLVVTEVENKPLFVSLYWPGLFDRNHDRRIGNVCLNGVVVVLRKPVLDEEMWIRKVQDAGIPEFVHEGKLSA